jgi:hypothetical protein
MQLGNATMWATKLLASATVCVAMGACAPAAAPEVLPVERADIQLLVTNDSWADAKIYVVAGGSLHRVGTVISMRRDAPVRLPQGLVSATRDCVLVVELIGSRARYVSPRLVLTPGETIDLRISNNLQLSHVSIW